MCACCITKKKLFIQHFPCSYRIHPFPLYIMYAVILPLQACKPSNHVCSTSPPLPQCLNQAPPGAQQLSLPDFLMVLHLEHMEPIAATVVTVVAEVGMRVLCLRKKGTDRLVSFNKHCSAFRQLRAHLCRPASLRAMCAQHLRCRHLHTS